MHDPSVAVKPDRPFPVSAVPVVPKFVNHRRGDSPGSASRSEQIRYEPGIMEKVDVAIVGAGAAGLMTAVWAGRTHPGQQVVVVDGAAKLGAKILVAGGGRCNVTHYEVDASAFAGSSPNAIKKVLRRFDVAKTRAFFSERGVDLKQEDTGKLFPVTDSAKSVLAALLSAAKDAGVVIRHPYRVERVARTNQGFIVEAPQGAIQAKKVVLATGGLSLPKSGSDGHGHQIARSLGHTITQPVLPSLVPLTLPQNHFLTALSGITLPATFDVLSGTGKRLKTFSNSTLLTHFGLSGPSVLDVSRYYLMAARADANTTLTVNWAVTETSETFEQMLIDLGTRSQGPSLLSLLKRFVPDRLARTLLSEAGIDGDELTREKRKQLVELTTRFPLPITGNRGYKYAEVTAGGVPLSELDLKTMESRVCPGLHIVGELCDVDGRIGGFNFQWAWSSGYVAGVSSQAK